MKRLSYFAAAGSKGISDGVPVVVADWDASFSRVSAHRARGWMEPDLSVFMFRPQGVGQGVDGEMYEDDKVRYDPLFRVLRNVLESTKGLKGNPSKNPVFKLHTRGFEPPPSSYWARKDGMTDKIEKNQA